MPTLLAVILISYLIGSIPTSIIAGKLFKGIDIREHGSGNAGTTNVFRVLGWKAGLIVGLIDLLKGLVPVIFVSSLAGEQVSLGSISLEKSLIQIIAGLTAVFGHIWTIFAQFKGGKGVLTAGGMLLGLSPIEVSICFAIFGVVFLATKYVSLGSLIAAISLSVIMIVKKYGLLLQVETPLLIFSFFITALIIYTHRSNIKRLMNGTENRFKKK